MTAEDRETGALDLLLVIAENVRLLVLGPLVIGFLAWFLAQHWSQSYRSQAILVLPSPSLAMSLTQPMQTPAQAASLMVSPVVLDPVIDALGLPAGNSRQATRERLASRVRPVAGKDGMLTLEVEAESPELAQSICAAVVDEWLKTTVPGPQEREYLARRLVHEKAALESVTGLIERLAKGGPQSLGKPLTVGEAGFSLVGLAELQERYFNKVLVIERDLQGFPRDVVRQAATLSSEVSRSSKVVWASMAATLTAIVLLLWVLARQAWKRSAKDPVLAEKQSKLVSALRLWRH